MIELPDLALPAEAEHRLRDLQTDVDAAAKYVDRVLRAKKLWDTKNNTKANKTCFDSVKLKLTEMCRGPRRCAYCEDSLADEIEHVKPKQLYPELVFAWKNYLYACGPCNLAKSSHFKVFKAGTDEVLDVGRTRNDPVIPPEVGDPLFIDPRLEDPMDFMQIDLLGTFLMVPRGSRGSRQYLRAEFTIQSLKLEEETKRSR